MPEDEVLAEIASAGYDGAPGGLRLERPVDDVLARFESHGLRPAPPYFSGQFWDPAAEDEILVAAPGVAQRVQALGCRDVYVAAAGTADRIANGKTRADIAGHVSESDAIDDGAFAQFGRVLSEFGQILAADGVHCCFHNHVGTVIETGQELARLLDNCSDDVYLGIDTGHLAWAGEDSARLCREYGERVKTLHLKDVYPEVVAEGRRKGWDYRTFTDHGVFAELGEGSVQFEAIVDDLRARQFDGWLIVETDVTTKASALESARISRDYLRTLGL